MKKYNEKKICFIICTNDEKQLNECLLYLSQLDVPLGYETEVLTITGAKSMAGGYNEGMKASDARYKIYLHQDTFIVEKNFLKKIIRVFKSDSQIGMLGVVGAIHLSKDGVMWHEERCGNFYRLDELNRQCFTGIKPLRNKRQEVEVIDGLLMATCVDIPWREDILAGWDFYDVSQCLEFRRKGYKIVVPAQRSNWVIHTCGVPSFWNYNKYRKIVLNEYPEINANSEKRLRILFYHSTVISLMGIPATLMDLGHNVNISGYKVSIGESTEAETEVVMEELEEGHYDLVVTYDFAPSVSKACEIMKVKYYAWVYDSPLLSLYLEETKGNYTYISVFDQKQYGYLKNRNIKNLFYLPLAPEVDIFGATIIRYRDEKMYTSDISFVGRFYNKIHFDEQFDDDKDRALREEAYRIIEECDCKWDSNTSLFGKASNELIDFLGKKDTLWQRLKMDERYFCESMKIVRKCNEVERIKILNKLAEKYAVTVYTDDSKNDELKNIEIRPWVDYISQMPKVFYLSKINLNISSRSIESGIPQRVWDILAVGGFCLTNYQPELEKYFEIGKDLDVYHNLEELMEKVDYYLKHEDQRIRVAINGYKKVRYEHCLHKRLQTALDYIFSIKEK